jgi:hypothetical protein
VNLLFLAKSAAIDVFPVPGLPYNNIEANWLCPFKANFVVLYKISFIFINLAP